MVYVLRISWAIFFLVGPTTAFYLAERWGLQTMERLLSAQGIDTSGVRGETLCLYFLFFFSFLFFFRRASGIWQYTVWSSLRPLGALTTTALRELATSIYLSGALLVSWNPSRIRKRRQ